LGDKTPANAKCGGEKVASKQLAMNPRVILGMYLAHERSWQEHEESAGCRRVSWAKKFRPTFYGFMCLRMVSEARPWEISLLAICLAIQLSECCMVSGCLRRRLR